MPPSLRRRQEVQALVLPVLPVRQRFVGYGGEHGSGPPSPRDRDVGPSPAAPSRRRYWCSRRSDERRCEWTGVDERQLPSGDACGRPGLLAHEALLRATSFQLQYPSTVRNVLAENRSECCGSCPILSLIFESFSSFTFFFWTIGN